MNEQTTQIYPEAQWGDRKTLIDTIVGQIQAEMQEACRAAARAAKTKHEGRQEDSAAWSRRESEHLVTARTVLDRLAELAMREPT